MKQHVHWILTIAALAVGVFGVTPIGSATVRTGITAAKRPLYASGILERGRRGPRGARGPRGFRGLRGRRGPAGAKGSLGDQGSSGRPAVAGLAQARAVSTVATGAYPGQDDPLTGNTWVQSAGEDDLVIGSF